MFAIKETGFSRLVGVWQTSGTIVTENETLELSGTDSYEYILDENYILHKADVLMGDQKSETFEIISWDASLKEARMQYFNSRGESGIMRSRIDKNMFRIEADKIKFGGSINDENTIITGTWYLQAGDNDWKEFIELKLVKQNNLSSITT